MAGLRVLQIVPSIARVYGGPSQMVRSFSRALGQAGAEVTLITTDANGDEGQTPLDVPLNQPLMEDNYRILYFRCWPFRRYKFSAGLLAWLSRHNKNYDVAHIHALFSPVSTAAAGIARRQRLPYLLRPLGTLDPADLQKKRWLKQLYGGLLERPNLAGAAAVHFTSAKEAEVSYRFGAPTWDLVIPLGVDPQPQLSEVERQAMVAQLSIPCNQGPLLLYLSRLDRKKGLELLVPALEMLRQERVPFHFVLAGANAQDAEYERTLRDRITRSALSQCTTLTGFVSDQARAALLQSADIFVLPSYYENFGIAVAEAMMAGVPVVISRGVYIWPDIAQGDAGWVCELTVEALAQSLRMALQEPQARQAKGANGQKYAAQYYRWDAIAQQTLAAYEGLLSQYPQSR